MGLINDASHDPIYLIRGYIETLRAFSADYAERAAQARTHMPAHADYMAGKAMAYQHAADLLEGTETR